MSTAVHHEDLAMRLPDAVLTGDLHVPDGACGLVVFAHGSGSGRKSRRNRSVAAHLRTQKLGTLLFDLLTPREDEQEDLRFDIPLLSERLAGAVRWSAARTEVAHQPIGLFGASTGAAAALNAAALLPGHVKAVVSRGGRPDLALGALPLVQCPTLLIVGGADGPVVDLNRAALHALRCTKELAVVPGATHLFEEPGALEEVARLAATWFGTHLKV